LAAVFGVLALLLLCCGVGLLLAYLRLRERVAKQDSDSNAYQSNDSDQLGLIRVGSAGSEGGDAASDI
jgi:hypothetical protein